MGFGGSCNTPAFREEIHRLPPIERFIVMSRIFAVEVGLVQSELTPVEIATSGLYGIYPYRQGSVHESGSSDASAEE